MSARRLQQSIHRSVEPGVLNVFRAFTLLEWAILSLGFLALLNKPPRWPDAYSIMLWTLYTFTLLYLSWPWLARTLGQAYLPLALVAVSVVPVVAQTADTLLHMAAGARGESAQADPARLYVWLLLPMLLIGAQYGVRVLLLFTGGTALLEVILAGVLAGEGGPPVARAAQDAGSRFLFYTIAGMAIVFLARAQHRYRQEQAQRQAERQAQLARYASALEQLAVSRERNRIAREMHDTLAHTLSAVSVQLKALEVLWDSDPVEARRVLRATDDLTRSGLDEARRALHALRASPIEQMGLALALRRAAEEAKERAGFALTFSAPPQIGELRPEVEQHLYRLGEEAINNVARHANARTVSVTLTQKGSATLLMVQDDGCGFDSAQAARSGHFGLTGMRERASLIGARLEVESQPQAGTSVRVVYETPAGGRR
jgi:signal transduction histidine kinase